MKDQRTFLKVKLLSLAAEARIIRKESHRTRDLRLKRQLREHRIGVVRNEARHTLLAYGFLRGRSYREMEQKTGVAPDWAKVRKMVEKYGADYDRNEEGGLIWSSLVVNRAATLARFEEWLKVAQTECI